MSMPLPPLSYTELDFPPAPSSPSFVSLFTDNSSSDLWCNQSLSLLDDCDSVSMLSHSSGDDTGSPASFFEPATSHFIDPMSFSASPPMFDNKQSPTFMNQGFKFDSYRFEPTVVAPAQPHVEQVIVEPLQQSMLPIPLAAEHSHKKSKRRSSSSNSSVASGDSIDSNKTRKPKRAKRSSSHSSDNDSRSTCDSSSLPHVDAGLVSSLLAESELKKNRLARKAELARLGRKAKNDQIESLQEKVKDLKARLQDAKDRNSNLAMFGSTSIKLESNSSSTLPYMLSVLDVTYNANATLVPRFMNWLSNQNEKFYCETNTRGLFNSLIDKHLTLNEQQKRRFIHVLKSHSHSTRQTKIDVQERFDAVDKAIKQVKHTK